jgi:hypothetical protein
MRNLHIAVRGGIVAGLLVAATGVLALAATPAGAACGCAALGAGPNAAGAVFQGTLTAVADPGLAQGAGPEAGTTGLQYTFRVDRVLRGQVGGTVVVRAPAATTACATTLVVGQRYEVAARVDDGGLALTGCADPATVDSDVLALGRSGASLTSEDGPDFFLILGLAGLSLIGAVAVTLLAFDHVRRVRRTAEPPTVDAPPTRPREPHRV